MEYIFNSDFGYTVSASILTSIGLGTNNLPKMIGGMLIAPLANPIIKIASTGIITDNIIQLIILILACIVIGIIYFNCFLLNDESFEPTERMIDIADFRKIGYWNDIIYGLVIGMTIYGAYGNMDLTSSNIIAGFAVGVTILPAFVNAGIMFGAGFKGFNDKIENLNLAVYGLSSSYVGLIYLVTVLIGFTGSMKLDEYYKSL